MIDPDKIDLTPDEIKELVIGAQTFLAPVPDERDDETLTPERLDES